MESLTPGADSSSAANEQVTLLLWASFHLGQTDTAVLLVSNSKHSIKYRHRHHHHHQTHHLLHVLGAWGHETQLGCHEGEREEGRRAANSWGCRCQCTPLDRAHRLKAREGPTTFLRSQGSLRREGLD